MVAMFILLIPTHIYIQKQSYKYFPSLMLMRPELGHYSEYLFSYWKSKSYILDIFYFILLAYGIDPILRMNQCFSTV